MRPLADPCATCAFGKGNETTRQPHNVLKSKICALSGIPFYCHHATNLHLKPDYKNFESIEAAIAHARERREELRQNGICRGWQREVRRLHANGGFGKGRIFRRAIGVFALERLEEFISNPSVGLKKKIFAAIKLLVKPNAGVRA